MGNFCIRYLLNKKKVVDATTCETSKSLVTDWFDMFYLVANSEKLTSIPHTLFRKLSGSIKKFHPYNNISILLRPEYLFCEKQGEAMD